MESEDAYRMEQKGKASRAMQHTVQIGVWAEGNWEWGWRNINERRKGKLSVFSWNLRGEEGERKEKTTTTRRICVEDEDDEKGRNTDDNDSE